MRKVILYIATSLDGFIARKNGSIDWLINDHEELDFGYNEFLSKIDITIMGSNTYSEVLSFGDFPYKSQMNYIFAKNSNFEESDNIKVIKENQVELVKALKAENGKDIWLIGGGEINKLFLDNNLIDKIYLFIKSVAIGNGISLFGNSENTLKKFKLISAKQFEDSFCLLEYDRL